MRVATKRDEQRERLIDSAEKTIARDGFAGLRARDLAGEIGISLGGVYNLVADMDELILSVSVRTLAHIDDALTEAAEGAGSPVEEMAAVAVAYCRFARDHLNLWRALFEHRMARGSVLPDWQANSQFSAFRHVAEPLARLAPEHDREAVDLAARTLFSAVHGVVMVGLDGKLLSVPLAALERQVVLLVRATCAGLPSILAEDAGTDVCEAPPAGR